MRGQGRERGGTLLAQRVGLGAALVHPAPIGAAIALRRGAAAAPGRHADRHPVLVVARWTVAWSGPAATTATRAGRCWRRARTWRSAGWSGPGSATRSWTGWSSRCSAGCTRGGPTGCRSAVTMPGPGTRAAQREHTLRGRGATPRWPPRRARPGAGLRRVGGGMSRLVDGGRGRGRRRSASDCRSASCPPDRCRLAARRRLHPRPGATARRRGGAGRAGPAGGPAAGRGRPAAAAERGRARLRQRGAGHPGPAGRHRAAGAVRLPGAADRGLRGQGGDVLHHQVGAPGRPAGPVLVRASLGRVRRGAVLQRDRRRPGRAGPADLAALLGRRCRRRWRPGAPVGRRRCRSTRRATWTGSGGPGRAAAGAGAGRGGATTGSASPACVRSGEAAADAAAWATSLRRHRPTTGDEENDAT